MCGTAGGLTAASERSGSASLATASAALLISRAGAITSAAFALAFSAAAWMVATVACASRSGVCWVYAFGANTRDVTTPVASTTARTLPSRELASPVVARAAACASRTAASLPRTSAMAWLAACSKSATSISSHPAGRTPGAPVECKTNRWYPWFRIIRRQQVPSHPASDEEGASLHVVIMGCGRVGSSLAQAVERLGHTVAVIDKDAHAFRRLGAEFHGQQLIGNGFDRDVLVKAGIERAEAFAAVSNGDNSNIISARVARETFGVSHVIARIYDARRAAVYERLGIPTVATVPWTTDRFLRTLLPDVVASAWRDPSGTVAILQLPLHQDWVGHSMREIQEATGCRVAFLMRFGTGVLPDAKTVLQADDVVYVAAVSGTVGDVTAAAARPPEEELH